MARSNVRRSSNINPVAPDKNIGHFGTNCLMFAIFKQLARFSLNNASKGIYFGDGNGQQNGASFGH
jgi:hypothetical protein